VYRGSWKLPSALTGFLMLARRERQVFWHGTLQLFHRLAADAVKENAWKIWRDVLRGYIAGMDHA